MKLTDLADMEVSLLLEWMRQEGIKTFSAGAISLTREDVYWKPTAQTIEAGPNEIDPQKETQTCGHPWVDSNEYGECLHGCIPEPQQDNGEN